MSRLHFYKQEDGIIVLCPQPNFPNKVFFLLGFNRYWFIAWLCSCFLLLIHKPQRYIMYRAEDEGGLFLGSLIVNKLQ